MDRSISPSVDSQEPLLASPDPATASLALSAEQSSTARPIPNSFSVQERTVSSLSSPSRRSSEVPGPLNRPPAPAQFDNPHAASAAAFQANHEASVSRQQRIMLMRLPPRHVTAPGGGLGYLPQHDPLLAQASYMQYPSQQGSVSPGQVHYARRTTMPYFTDFPEGAGYQRSFEGTSDAGSANQRGISVPPMFPVGSPPTADIPPAPASANALKQTGQPVQPLAPLSSSLPETSILPQTETNNDTLLQTVVQPLTEESPELGLRRSGPEQYTGSQPFNFVQENGFGRIDVKAIAQFFEQGPTTAKVQKRPPLANVSHKRLRFMFYSDKSGPVRANSVERIDLSVFNMTVPELLESGPFWLDVCDPTDTELQQISRAFGIHPLTREDIQTPDTREKCELFTNYYFVVIRSFEQDEVSSQFLQAIPIYLVVFRDCIISIQYSSTPHAPNVLYRIEQLKSYGLNVTSDWINYAMIDDILDSFSPILKSVEFEVDSIDDLVLILKESEQSDMLGRIGRARKRVMQLVRLLTSKADLIKMVINRVMERVSPESETRYYLEDIHDHVITMNQNAVHYEKTLARTHSNYLAQISIEITQASNRTGDVAMKMTAVASIMVPLNVITGLWGMNVKVPGQDEESLYWFAGIVMSMLVVALSCYWIVRKANLV